ncbi:MAG: O-antigen ligase family protein [Sedimentisphaerales bacterium]|nr:O-antigen ligase family protein [Sedimentisphaerales bacterium]
MNLENWLTNCTWIILIFMAVSQVIGLISGNLIRGYGSDYASAGLIDQPSVTATLIVSTLPVFLQSFPYKRMSLAGIIICLVSLFFTMRRTVLIAAIAAIFLVLMYDFFPFRRRIRKSTVIIAILTLCALGIISLRTQAGADLLARMSDLNPLYGTGSGRYTFWFIALKHILNRNIISMIMGDGLGRIRDVMYNDFGMYIGSHNDLLDFTYAFGIFGLFTLIWWYYELIRFTNYLRINKATAFQGSLSVITIFIIISMGQGGESYNPDLALIFMILGIWAGQKSYV